MNYTLREAMSLDALSSGIIIAGEKGLHRIIKKVSVLETPFSTEESFPIDNLQSNSCELVISALYAVANNERAQLKILENLDAYGCSGLILCYVDTWLKTVSDSFIELANRLNFPVIVVSDHVSYSDIITAVMDKVLNIQSKNLEHSLRTYEEMIHAILHGNGSSQLIQILESKINRQVLYLTPQKDWTLNKSKNYGKDILEQLSQTIDNYILDYFETKKDLIITSPFNEGDILITPITSASIYYGTLVISHPDSLSEMDYITISQAKNTFATISLNQVRIHKLLNSNKKEYLYNILHGAFTNDAQAIAKASSLNIYIEDIKVVIVGDLNPGNDISKRIYSGDELKHFKEIRRYMRSELSTYSSEFFMSKTEDTVIILVPDKGDKAKTVEYAQNVCKQLILSVKKYLDIDVLFGIGNYHTRVIDIEKSYKEAVQVLETVSKVLTEYPIAYYEDFQLYCNFHELFLSNKSPMTDSSCKLLEPLIQYDRMNDTQLFETFEMLMENQLSTAIVSDKMFIHKNTLLQRKRKILQILQRDPFDTPYYNQYHMALLIRKLTH